MIKNKLSKIDSDIITLQAKIKELKKSKQITIKKEKENIGNFIINKVKNEKEFGLKFIELLKEFNEVDFSEKINLFIKDKDTEDNINKEDKGE